MQPPVGKQIKGEGERLSISNEIFYVPVTFIKLSAIGEKFFITHARAIIAHTRAFKSKLNYVFISETNKK